MSLPAPISGTNYALVFDDEFTGSSINTANWKTVSPWTSPVSSTWSEFSYSSANVVVANSLCTIEALSKSSRGRHNKSASWTGGIIQTNGLHQWQYGFFEASVLLPAGAGFWPAFWVLCVDNANGDIDEIDIMEFLGDGVSSVYQTVHYNPDNQQQVVSENANWTSAYHLFQMLWTASTVTFYIDNVETASYAVSIDTPCYLMLNFDVGDSSDWSGGVSSSTPSPAYYNIDYVRVYQLP